MSLKCAHIDTAALDARLLLQHVLGVSHERLLADDLPALTPGQEADYQELIRKRGAWQPLAQLTGRREFYGWEFKVTEHTLDPRPDSETLIDAVLEFVERGTWNVEPDNTLPRTTYHAPRILDLGTGTGCLLLTLLKEIDNARGVGVDISEEALNVARDNAIRLGLQERALFARSHWGDSVEGKFDIIVANPPYIPTHAIATLAPEVSRYEPRLALDGGEDGLNAYRAIMPQLPLLLADGGIAAFEIGMGQEEEVEKIVTSYELRVAGMKCDLGGIPRCILVQHSS